MSVLVTGGAGFIGAEVVRSLVANGKDRPIIFSRNPRLDHMGVNADEVEIVRGDIGNFSHVLDAVNKTKPDVIYHFGAMLSTAVNADPASAIQTNAMGTFHVLEAARIFGVRQVIFASSIATYGSGIKTDVIDDFTLQRPTILYGTTKVFGEQLGLFYKSNYGLDFRGLRFPSIIGPGVKNPGILQYNSWVIEESAKGNPFTIQVKPDMRIPVMYIKEAGQAAIQLSEAPLENISTAVYNIDGMKPTPSAQDLVDAVERNIPSAQINFELDEELQAVLARTFKMMDDSQARSEWGWNPTYDLDGIVNDLVAELEQHPDRYE